MLSPRISDTVRWFELEASFFSLILLVLFLMLLGTAMPMRAPLGTKRWPLRNMP